MRAIALLLAGIATAVAAQDTSALFKELTTDGTTGVRRDELVTELSARTFAEVGTQAVRAIISNRDIIYNPRTKKPWLEEQCPESERIRFAADAVWQAVIQRAEAGSLAEPLAKLCLEDRPEDERLMYLNALLSRHYQTTAKPALERLASDQAQPAEINVGAAEILVRKADADAYLPVLLKACDRIENALQRSEIFRFTTVSSIGSMTGESKKALVKYGFARLSEIDDGKGRGYFLAIHLGRILGVKPIREGQGEFAPDQRLPQYQGKNGLDESFFQDTVNNSREWWRMNRQDYEPKN